MENSPQGWYPDPQDPGLLRWWNGLDWSPYTKNAQGQEAPAALPDAAPPPGNGQPYSTPVVTCSVCGKPIEGLSGPLAELDPAMATTFMLDNQPQVGNARRRENQRERQARVFEGRVVCAECATKGIDNHRWEIAFFLIVVALGVGCKLLLA